MASWLHRTALASLLLLAYLYAWTPARTLWTEHLATPVCTAVSPPETTVTPRPTAHTVRLQPANGSGFTYQAPAGVKFLLPGLFLILLVPIRPRLGLFLGGHLALGGLALILAVGGTTGLPGGFTLAQFVQEYGVDAYSLAVPVLLFARRT